MKAGPNATVFDAERERPKRCHMTFSLAPDILRCIYPMSQSLDNYDKRAVAEFSL